MVHFRLVGNFLKIPEYANFQGQRSKKVKFWKKNIFFFYIFYNEGPNKTIKVVINILY